MMMLAAWTTVPATSPMRITLALMPTGENPLPPMVTVPALLIVLVLNSNVSAMTVPWSEIVSVGAATDTVSPMAMTEPALIMSPLGAVADSTMFAPLEMIVPTTVMAPISAMLMPLALTEFMIARLVPSFRARVDALNAPRFAT